MDVQWTLLARARSSSGRGRGGRRLEGWGRAWQGVRGEVVGPAVDDELWGEIMNELSRLGWRVTLDLFASESNARCPRFCCKLLLSWVQREWTFSMPDWSQ